MIAHTCFFALGCFWGAEKLFWTTPGVIKTSVGYMGGQTVDPTYEQVCSGRTGHAEVVRVEYDPELITYERLVQIFFENHDPTQGNRQGNDVGTQYRSAIFVTGEEQRNVAELVRDQFQAALLAKGFGTITTQIAETTPFYPAEDYHQRYLEKNPGGYCPIHATGVTCG